MDIEIILRDFKRAIEGKFKSNMKPLGEKKNLFFVSLVIVFKYKHQAGILFYCIILKGGKALEFRI